MRLFTLISTAALLAAGAASADTVSDVLAANKQAVGGAAFDGKHTLELKYAFVGDGLSGVSTTTYDVHAATMVDTFEAGVTKGANGYDGRTAWQQDPSGAITPEDGGDTRQISVSEGYEDANLWWRADRGGAAIQSLGQKTDDGQTYDVLSVTPVGGKPFEAWFDAKTHLLARTIEAQGFQTITTFISDYRPVDGVMLAGKQVIDDGTGVAYRQTETLTEAKFTARRPAAAYAMPKIVLTDGVINNPAGRTSVPFQLMNNHIYAEVKVNGKGPFLFIFDTGGHDLLVPETAKALAVKSVGAAPGSGAGEGTVDTGFARHVTFQIGDLTLKDQDINVLPFASHDTEGLDEQGMIGFEVFRRFVTRFDYGSGTLTFIDPAKFDPKDAGVAVPFVFYNQLPQVDGTFEGLPAQFDIDTGSRVELTLTKPFVDANHLIASHPKGVTATDGWGVGGPSRSYVTRGGELTLGPVKVDGFVAGFATQGKGAFSDPNYQGNVGTGLLKRFVVTFDYDHQIMYLKAIVPTPTDIAQFDRAGVWINDSAKGFKIVDLVAGGPADAAGLKVGDEITAVDDAPSASIRLTDMRQKLRDTPAGTVLKLTVDRGGQTQVVSLTLKDQI